MAKTAKIVKAQKLTRKLLGALARGSKMKKATKQHNICELCGRPRGFMRRFHMCRICFRLRARRGEIVGVKKSSW